MTLSLGTHIGRRVEAALRDKRTKPTGSPRGDRARPSQHRGDVRRLDYDGRLCLVQEWIDGGSLADELGLAGQLGVQETVRLGRDVASALSYAHQQGILHRDIKPSNVLRTVEGTYKLADFGAFGQLQVETDRTGSDCAGPTKSRGAR